MHSSNEILIITTERNQVSKKCTADIIVSYLMHEESIYRRYAEAAAAAEPPAQRGFIGF